MTQDLYYYESGYFDPELGYYVYTADAESQQSIAFTVSCVAKNIKGTQANLSAQASQSVSAGVIKNASATWTSYFAQTATISHIEGADLFAMSNAALEAQVSRLRDNNIEASSQFTIATDGKRIRYVSAEEDANFSVAIVPVWFRNTEAAFDAAFSLAITFEHYVEGEVELTASLEQTTDNIRVRYADSALDTDFEVYCDPERIPGGVVVQASGDWIATIALDASVGKIIQFESAEYSLVDIAVTCYATSSATTAFNLAFTQTTSADRIRDAEVIMISQFGLSVSASRTRDNPASLTVSATVSATPYRIKQFVIAESALFSPSINAGIIIFNVAGFSVTTSLTANVVANKGTFAYLNSTFTQTSSAVKTVLGSANLNSAFTQTTNGDSSHDRPLPIKDYTSVSISSTQSKFGGSSLFCAPGNIQYLANYDTIPGASEDFYISLWIRPSANTSRGIVSHSGGSTSNSVWTLALNSSGKLQFKAYTNSTGSGPTITGATTVTLNTWHHVAVSRSGGSTISVWLDGVREAQGSTSLALNLPSNYNNIWVGFGSTSNFSGYIDELEMKVGTYGIYNGANTTYTLPTQASVNDDLTHKFLFHYNTDFTDDALTKQGVASLTSTATIVAQPDNRIKTASANLQVTGSELIAIGKIVPEFANLSSAFTLTTSATKIKKAQADLTSAFTLTSSALDLDLAQIALTSTSTVTATAFANKKTQAALSSRATVYCNPDQVYLSLYYGAGSTTGYISSTGTTIRNSFTGRTTSQDYGWDPVFLSFWIRLDSDLAINTTQTIFTTGSRTIKLKRNSDGSYRFEFSYATTYYINYSNNPSYPDSWQEWIDTTTAFRTIPAGTDMTDWHSIQMPLDIGLWKTGNIWDPNTAGPGNPGDEGIIGIPTISTYLDGTLLTGTVSNNSVYTGGGGGTYHQTHANDSLLAGTWGSSTNTRTMYLDEIWIKSLTYSSTTGTYETVPATTDFYTGGNQAFITKLGVTASGKAAQVWLPFRNLLDSATTKTPAWNYTATNVVVFGFIEYGEANLVSTSTITARVTRVVYAQAALTSTSTINATGLRIKKSQAALNSTATVNAIGQKNAILSSAFNSTATVTARLSRTEKATVQATSQATLTVTAIKVTVGSANLTSTATQVINNVRTRALTVSATSQFTQTTNAIKTARAASVMQASGAELAIVSRVGRGLIHMDSTATLTVTGKITADRPVHMASQAILTATGQNIQLGRASLTATATETITPTYLRRNESIMTARATLTVTPSRTRRNSASLSSAFSEQVSTQNSKITRITANLISQAAIVSRNQILRLGQANLVAEADMPYVIAGVLVRFEADLICEGFELVAGRIIHIDEYYQLKIPNETRFLRIIPESRLLVVNQETRVNKIIG